MSNITETEIPVKTVSIQELRDLLDSNRPIQFWNVLTNQWFKGENITGSRRVPLDKVGQEVRATNLPQERGNRRILRRPELSAKPYGGGEADQVRLRKRSYV